MCPHVRPARRLLFLPLLAMLVALPGRSDATDNIWQATFGQRWFYEVRSYPNEVLAGTWWESALTPGTTYNISFDVDNLQGEMAVLVGDNAAVKISKPGSYSYNFRITETGKRRMLFRTESTDVQAGVSSIVVSKSTSTSSGTWIPKGHYLSFARERNFKTEMMDLIDKPWTAPSDYAMNKAEELDEALRTPGVKGFWIEFPWDSVEVGDGQYDWRALDDNMAVARRYGLKFLINIADRSFNGVNIMPDYFPSQYVLATSNSRSSGYTAKRWDPYVYNRIIRIYKAIAKRYASNPGFGGIATAETALGISSGEGGYTPTAYRYALTQIATQTQAAMSRGKLFLYLNFLKGGDNSDMNRDARVKLLRNVPHHALVVGGPDITPDVKGMPASATPYRIHVRKNMPSVSQFCHLQHRDQGIAGINTKKNYHRKAYLDKVATVRERESQKWFSGTPAVFEFDDLRDPQGNKVTLHPNWVIGDLWQPDEVFSYAKRNFDCDYILWHYRDRPKHGEFGWPDVRTVILNNKSFYNW